MNRFDFRATAAKVLTKNGSRTDREASTYPTVPAGWPNRATRRAAKQGREFRLSAAWKAVLANRPALRLAIHTL